MNLKEILAPPEKAIVCSRSPKRIVRLREIPPFFPALNSIRNFHWNCSFICRKRSVVTVRTPWNPSRRQTSRLGRGKGWARATSYKPGSSMDVQVSIYAASLVNCGYYWWIQGHRRRVPVHCCQFHGQIRSVLGPLRYPGFTTGCRFIYINLGWGWWYWGPFLVSKAFLMNIWNVVKQCKSFLGDVFGWWGGGGGSLHTCDG